VFPLGNVYPNVHAHIGRPKLLCRGGRRGPRALTDTSGSGRV